MDPDVEQWLATRYWPEDDLLRDLRADLERRGPAIQVGAATGRLLGLLVTLTGARRVLEVGTLFGYSAVWLARALPPGGRLDTVELDPVHADAAEHWLARAGLDDRVTVHRGPGAEVVRGLPGPYDLAFVDADKAGYRTYAELALERLRPGGLLLADNVLWHGALLDPADTREQTLGIRALHDLLAGHPGLETTVLDVGDGLSVSVKR